MKSKNLFTPGPLTTSKSVKEAMLLDLGSRDEHFIALVRGIRERLLKLAGVQKGDFDAIIMQGSGTFSLEAVVSSLMPPNGKMLALVNGAYGKRVVKIAHALGIEAIQLEFPENEHVSLDKLKMALEEHPDVFMVSIAHCETTTGIMNPIAEIGTYLKSTDKTFFVDAMSTFGAVPISMVEEGIDVMVSSANKCIQGVPGFGYAIVRHDLLLKSKGWARSLSFDLYDQWKGLEEKGQFRFTPPTHTLLAFDQALNELEEEGGVAGRARRYAANHACILEGMTERGFEVFIDEAYRSYIITSFLYPDHPNFDFQTFYRELSARNQVIYPGKLTHTDCFRIGNIGDLNLADMNQLLTAIDEVCENMQISLPLTLA